MIKAICLLSATLLPLFAPALDESFDGNPGPDLPAGWDAGAVDWIVDAGALRFRGGDYAFAWPTELGPGGEVTVETTVRVQRRATTGWGVAAVTVRQDARNYWHLALVEAPPENGGGHFVELAEKLDNVWLAHHERSTKLTATVWEGTQFGWQAERPYRMRLVMRTDGIDGRVTELDGTVRAHIAYTFDGRAVNWGEPALAASCLDASFDDVKMAVALPRARPPGRTLPAYDRPGDEAGKMKATGFFHTERRDGLDWIVDPNGRAFYVVATDHVSYQGHWCEKLGYAPYARVAQAKYTNEENWAVATVARLNAWGFNTLAAGHSPSLRHRGIPHIDFVAFGASFAGRDGLAERTTWTGFPNVFSPDWPRHCDLLARQRAEEQKNDPWLVGRFLDNELEWYGKSHQPEGLFDQAWLKPAGHTAKRAWIDFLRQRPGGIAAFNAQFGTGFTDFAALTANMKPMPPATDAGRTTARDFVRLVAERYFKTCSDALKRHDPQHLNLGCRFAGRAPDIWDIAGRYCDVVSLNTYPRIDVDRGVPAQVARQMGEWQMLSGKPFMITEWSFPALDAGLPSRHGAGMRVDTQAQRARCFSFFQDFLFRTPQIVGSCYFMYLDEPALGISASFPEDSNYGLINGDDVPYAEITTAAAALNPEANHRHRQGGYQPVPSPVSTALPAWLREAEPTKADIPSALEFKRGRTVLAWGGGAKAWSLSLDGRPVAEIHPLLHLIDGQDFWLPPVSARIVAHAENARALRFDVTFQFRSTPQDPRVARATMRYWIPKGDGGWIASQGLNVENAGDKAWRLGDLYHYLSPRTDADPAKIEPLNDIPSYYREVAAWADRARDLTVGAWVLPGSRLKGEYWKDCPTCFHSDMREAADHDLAPGARWNASPDVVFFYATPAATRASHAAAGAQIMAQVWD